MGVQDTGQCAEYCALPSPHRCEEGIVIRLMSGRVNPVNPCSKSQSWVVVDSGPELSSLVFHLPDIECVSFLGLL